MAFIAVTFLMPFYLIQALELSPSSAGLLLTTIPLMWFFLSPGAGWLSDRIGSRYLATGGLALLGLGIFLLSRLDLSASWGDVVLCLGVTGLGGGIFLSPNYSAIMGSVARERLGTASALIPTARTIGHACGLALAGTVFASRMLFHSAQHPAQPDTARPWRWSAASRTLYWSPLASVPWPWSSPGSGGGASIMSPTLHYPGDIPHPLTPSPCRGGGIELSLGGTPRPPPRGYAPRTPL